LSFEAASFEPVVDVAANVAVGAKIESNVAPANTELVNFVNFMRNSSLEFLAHKILFIISLILYIVNIIFSVYNHFCVVRLKPVQQLHCNRRIDVITMVNKSCHDASCNERD